jgi:putative flippase GtrA
VNIREDESMDVEWGLAAEATARLAPARQGPYAKLQTLRHNRELRRLIAYLIAGGLSAIVTLTITSTLTELAHQPFLWAAIIGTELGILVNFSINDRLAFRDLEGHHRRWIIRLLRFHVTCATGQSLILLFSLALHDLAGWRPVFAQGLPIIVVTAFNFIMHRFWTYRGAGQRSR